MPSFRFRVRGVLGADGDVGVEFGYAPAAIAGMPAMLSYLTAGARCSDWHVLTWSCPFVSGVGLAFTRDGYVMATTDSQREATPLVGWKGNGIVPEAGRSSELPGILASPGRWAFPVWVWVSQSFQARRGPDLGPAGKDDMKWPWRPSGWLHGGNVGQVAPVVKLAAPLVSIGRRRRQSATVSLFHLWESSRYGGVSLF